MDIKFIWIKEHRLLKNLNFNFCHDGLHEFQYENDCIEIYSIPEYPIHFGKNIRNITGIAGKNGSGKSSFCEVVLESIATYRDGSFGFHYGFNGIVCFGDHFFIKNEIKVANEEDLTALGYQIVRYIESPFEDMKPEWRSSFAKIRFIYYSNFLDRKSGQWENNLYNISTQNYLLYDKIYSTFPIYHLKWGNWIDHKKVDKYSEYETHVVQEDFRNLRFITKFPNFVPFFGEHTFVNLHSSYSGNNRFLNPDETTTNVGEQLSELEYDIFNEVYPNFHVQIEKTISVKQTITVNQETHKRLLSNYTNLTFSKLSTMQKFSKWIVISLTNLFMREKFRIIYKVMV
jgi:hypothetical protein